MSKDILDKMKAAGEKHDDPVLDAVTEVCEFTVTRSKQQDERLEKQDAKLSTVERSVVHETERVRTEMETGFKMVADKLEAVQKRTSIVSGLSGSFFDSTDKVLAAIPESKRDLVRRSEAIIRSQAKGKVDKGTLADDAVLRAASGLWYARTMKLQMAQYASEHEKCRKELGAINQAFEDAYGKATYAEGATTTGGFLVPEIIAADLLRIVQDNGVIVSRARHIPMASDDMKIPNEATGVTAYWSGENFTLTQGEGTFGQNTLTAKKLIGRATLTREVVDDAVVAIIPYLQQAFAEKIARQLDTEAMEGTGTNFTGVITDAGTTVATTTTNGEAISYQDLVSTIFAGGDETTRDNAAFFMNPKIFATVVGLVDTTGQPIFQYANVPGAPYKTILGFPVYLTSALSVDITRGSSGSTGNVYFGDPRNLIFGDRMALRFEVTDQVGWDHDRIDARMIGRWGFTVANAGAWTKLVGGTLL